MMTESKGEVDRRRVAGPVRITLPAMVAYNPDELKTSIRRIAEQIGHPECVSGFNCLFQMEREFLVNPKGVATAATATTQAFLEPDPTPWRVSVGLSSGVTYDLDKVLVAVDKTIDLIGPHPCISGFDVLFRNELNTVVVNEQLEAQAFIGQKF